ncbi:Na+/H+ antiporter subunit E [Chloroflexota bacterium]
MRMKWTVIGIEFISLFLFWILLSGRFQLKYLIIGLIASGIVTCFTSDLLYRHQGEKTTKPSFRYMLVTAMRLFVYSFWLFWAVIKANIQIAAIILNPKMPVDPGILNFKTGLRNRIALVTLGNSITLTPGTFTIAIKSGTYIIHYLLPKSADDLRSDLMQNKVIDVFSDNMDHASAHTRSYFSGELKSTKEIKQ